MRDATLTRLVEEAMGPFPPGLGGTEIGGVDLVLLDDAIIGTASHYGRNSRPLSAEHQSLLEVSLRDLDGIWEDLPTDEARAHLARTRAVGVYLLDRRSRPTP